jgi:hypothetical protein
MKQILLTAALVILTLAFSATAYAADTANAAADTGVSITIVIPNSETEPSAPAAELAPKSERYLYPVSVWESLDNGRREIIRTYELGAGEKPEDISRESFSREGWLYELADITRTETANADAKEHKETVSIDTSTNEMAAILNLLAPTMEYQSEDGYIGVLELDIASIKVETAGTKSSSYTVSATREYPNLSSNDTSQIPKTITDGGRTLTLSNIDWKTRNYDTVDYSQITESYTGYATYTGTASKTTVTGYVTTAEYTGTVSKILTGKTVYTAYFIGVPIVTATVNETVDGTATPDIPADETATDTADETATPAEAAETPEPSADADAAEKTQETETERKDSGILPVVIAVLFGAGIGGGLMFYYLNKIKKSKEETAHETEDTPHEDEENAD